MHPTNAMSRLSNRKPATIFNNQQQSYLTPCHITYCKDLVCNLLYCQRCTQNLDFVHFVTRNRRRSNASRPEEHIKFDHLEAHNLSDWFICSSQRSILLKLRSLLYTPSHSTSSCQHGSRLYRHKRDKGDRDVSPLG